MKKNFDTYKIKRKEFVFSFFFAFNMFGSIVHAQYSQGGQPYRFENNFSESLIQNLKEEILPTFNLDSMQAEDAVNDQNKTPYRFGYNHLVNFNLNNSGLWITLPNGDRLWQLRIKSPNALSLNLAFDDFFMPEGGKLFIYSADKSFVIGAFTKVNNQDDKAFATDLLQGDAVILEYYEPAEVSNKGRIKLFRVTHGYRGMKDYIGKSFAEAGSCQTNINCPLGANWQNEKNSVVFLITAGNIVCSGALINDVPQDSKPYILTANHCSSTGYSTWVFRFKWEAPLCTNPATNPTSVSLTGCVKRAANPGTDMSLVEITGGLIGQTIPANYNPYFAGWSRINTPADSVVCIHHPMGDIKKISQALNATQSVIYAGANCWKIGQWTTGCTERGSSGSALFDQNHRIVGQLYGGPSACGVSADSLYDNYGKFATSWLGGGTDSTQLKHWLDPENTGTTTLNGTNIRTYNADSNTRITTETEIVSSFTIYPNPSNGEFNIDIKISKPQNVTAKIIDLIGQTIYTTIFTNATTGTYNIDIGSESTGIYFLELSTPTTKSVKKISVLR